MNIESKTGWISFAFGVACAALLQVCVSQRSEIQSLHREVRLLSMAKDLAEDQIRELGMAVSNMTAERESTATKNFVMGVVEATKNPERYEGVWHDGYNHGMEVRSYTTGQPGLSTE